MSVEENLRKVDATIEAFNDHDLDRYIGLRAESIVRHSPDEPAPLKGRAAVRENLKSFHDGFPDGHLENVRAFGRGAFTVVELMFSGTHTGPLPGPDDEAIPATNRPVRFPTCLVLKFEGGEVVEEREYYDQLGMMAQLGLVP